MKWCAAIVLLVCSVVITTGSEYPWSWSVEHQWTAHAVPLGNRWLLHRQLPAWQSADPMLAIVDNTGILKKRAFDTTDIRAVGVWRKNVVAVCTSAEGTEVIVLDTMLNIQHRALLADRFLQPSMEVEVLSRSDCNTVFIRVDHALYSTTLPSMHGGVQPIEQGVFGATVGQGQWLLLMVHDVGGMAYARLLDTNLQSKVAPAVPLAQRAVIGQVKNMIAVISPVDVGLSTQVSVVNLRTASVRTITVDVPSNHVTWINQDGSLALAIVHQDGGRQYLMVTKPENAVDLRGKGVALPEEFGIADGISSNGDTLLVWSDQMLATIVDGSILSVNTLGQNLAGYDSFIHSGNVMVATGSSGSLVLRKHFQPWWWLWWFITVVGPFVLPLILIALILIQTLRLRGQRRFLDAMLEVPGAGLVFVFDASGKLLRTNERSASLLRITTKVPMGRLYRAYMRHAGVSGLQEFVTHALEIRKPVSEKVTIDDDDNQREYMVTAQPLWGTFSKLRGFVVTGIDITETLERRRLVNWAQLAHDMQTNLSTVRLNAEQLSTEMGQRDQERVRRILFQTGVLIQRVRDLVSVGRSEELQRTPVHSAEFCTQIRHEFDPVMFPQVTFVMKLRGTMMLVDKLKLSRAVRNAVENAIKSLRGAEGTVEIATWFDRQHVYIRVADTGVGMDTLTLENMMKPYFTTAKDGQGTGIGTMIMQHVTHMHGGSLRVTSEPGQGTQVVFRIPIEQPTV